MSEQPDLFSSAVTYGTEPRKLARRDNPETSKQAAQSVETTRLERMVHEAIRSYGEKGCCAYQLLEHRFRDLAYSSVTARFSALERKGLIKCGPDKRKGPSGRAQRVMRSIVNPQ